MSSAVQLWHFGTALGLMQETTAVTDFLRNIGVRHIRFRQTLELAAESDRCG